MENPVPAYHLYMWSPKSGILQRDLETPDPKISDLLESIHQAGRLALRLSGRSPPACAAEAAKSFVPTEATGPRRAKRRAILLCLRRAESLLAQLGDRRSAHTTHQLRNKLAAAAQKPRRPRPSPED